MKYVQGVVVIVAACLSCVNAGRILAIHGTDLQSHFRVFSAVVELLAPYHNITLYAGDKFKYSHPNVVVRSVNSPSRFNALNMTKMLENACNIDSYTIFYDHILNVNASYYEEILTKNDIPNLFKTNDTYDLLLLSGYGTDQFIQFAHKHDVPIVQVTPSLLMPWHSDFLNNPHSWVNDFSFMVLDNTNSFYGRLKKFFKNGMINRKFYSEHLSVLNAATKKYFPPGTPGIEEVSKRTDLMLVNTHDVMGYSRPNVRTILEVGGMHIKSAKALPDYLEAFISGAGDHGFIYFSLGTLIDGSALAEDIRNAMVNVFRKLPQRVLWKWKGKIENLPSNVMVSNWFPQIDVLAHKNIKLFILQGGMLSMQEAIYNGVPVFVLPVIFDQYLNAFMATQKGFGRSLTFCDFTEHLFYTNIKELIQNTTHSDVAKGMSLVMKDQNLGISNKIKFWIDFVIRHKGTSMLKPIIQYESWKDVPYDILSFFIVIIYIVYYVCINLFKCVYTKTIYPKTKTN